MASINAAIPSMLGRLQGGTESGAQFERDVERSQVVSDQLYRDASPLARADPTAFAVLNDVVIRIDRVIFGEDLLDAPDQVDPASIGPARTAISTANAAVKDGTIACPSPKPQP